MSSVSESSPYSVSNMKDIDQFLKRQAKCLFSPFQSYPTSSQYFNMRVSQRVQRYRSMQRKWKELPTSVQNHSSLSATSQSPTSLPDISQITDDTLKILTTSTQKPTVETKPYCINEYINAIKLAKENNNKNLIDLDPLHPRIQQDLIKLRKLIKGKQGKHTDNSSLKTLTSSRSLRERILLGTTPDDQENNDITKIRRPLSSYKLKPLDHVKIFGSHLHPSTCSKADSADSGIGSNTNSSSTCSQYSKVQQQLQQQQQQQQQQ
ncbi:unnamed protein product, partial [Rotaria magnacalcarata]